MSKLKRRLALFLSMLMLISSTAVTSYAEETVKGDADVVIYNLGEQEITIGYDEEQAEADPSSYKLFDEEGDYTIPLEDNAFFPYEVQFKFGDTVAVEWFDTPESTVLIGGHTLRVYSEQNDDTMLSQIGVWIDGEYIAARPETKTFTNSLIKPLSLLPLKVVNVSLDLSSYNRFQLKNVEVSAILSGFVPEQTIEGSDKVVWMRLNEIVEQTGTIDLSYNYYYSDFTVELIVGSALQLDDSNTRYIVGVITDISDIVQSVDLYVEEEIRDEAEFSRTSSSNGRDDQYNYFYLPSGATEQTYYLGLTLNQKYNSYDVKVIENRYDTADAAIIAAEANPVLDVTDKVINQMMTDTGNGLEISFYQSNWKYFSLIFYDGSTIVGFYRVTVSIQINRNGIDFNWLYTDTGTDVVSTASGSTRDGIEVRTNTMYSQYPADAEYYLRLYYMKDGMGNSENRSFVDKAVLGHYNTMEEAVDEADIKDQLFPESWSEGSGYLANYSGDGQNFTIFAEGEVYKITVKAVDSQTQIPIGTILPNPGSSDTYFRMQRASGLKNVYVLPYQHDTYYDMGYQTVFYIDDVELSSLKPTFSTGYGVNVYSGHSGGAGELQVSSQTVADFSNGPVQYAAAAENGADLKNYWVTFVKKHTGGSKLFVNGINGDEGAKREVFLTGINSYSNVHDIFIANVGDEILKGLNVTLENAQNIKLDPYWTVGGEGNDTLAAFETTSTSSYSQLPNVAKIRLLPDGEGEISGTLTITANGQEPVVIILTGSAGDPKLTTSEIPKAIKYVPYAVQILHNNRYSWNVVTLTMNYGTLPEGVILKPNGELYGVPKETGTFHFGIEMTNSDTRFARSYASYTLVVDENTNDNVDDSTDVGYTLSKRLGTRIGNEDVITVQTDQEFVSEGNLNEFVDFWLNGEKLTENVDYTRESGSTKITIRSQTFKDKADQNSTNTIAAEFRVDGNENNELKRTAQNFKIVKSIPSPTPTPRPTSTPSPTSRPLPTSTPTPTPVPTSAPVLMDEPQFTGEDGKAILGWKAIRDEINKLLTELQNQNGEEIIETINFIIDMKNVNTIPKEILNQIKGQNIILRLEMENGVAWLIHGNDILEKPKDIDLSVDMTKTNISTNILEGMKEEYNLEEGVLIQQLVLKHNGEFGFAATLEIKLGKEANGLIANLFYFNPETKQLELQSVDKAGKNGVAYLTFTHASDYVIVLSNEVLVNDFLINQITVRHGSLDKPTNRILYLGGTTGNVRYVKAFLPIALQEAVDKELMTLTVRSKASNGNVAISKTGTLKPKTLGKSMVTTTVSIGDKVLDFLTAVTVKNPSIHMLKAESMMKVGEKYNFIIKSYGYAKEDITWETLKRDKAVVSKNAGKLSVTVHSKSVGKDTIVIKVNGIEVQRYAVSNE